MQFINFVLGIAEQFQYPLLFGVIFLFGDAALIPALYLAWFGPFDVLTILLLSLGTVTLSDTIWYIVGSGTLKKKEFFFPVMKKYEGQINRYGELFHNHAFKIVFTSKFLFGLRIPFQILAGMHRLGYPRYILTSVTGSILWMLGIATLIGLTNLALPEIESIAAHIQVGVTIFVLLLVGIWTIKKKVQGYLLIEN